MVMLLLPLILSEVLANEPGSASALEWIELHSTATVQLSEFTLRVNGDPAALPPWQLDSGLFVVLCRDSLRFEEHFGDSSGVWGDHPAEQYPRLQVVLSLPNSRGEVELIGPAQTDLFAYSGTAPDGVSYERIGDTAWQVTSAHIGSTPGAANHGAPVRFDWAILSTHIEPGAGHLFRLLVAVGNLGTDATSSVLRLTSEAGQALDSASLHGEPGEIVATTFDVASLPGLNGITARLGTDDRSENNERSVRFYGKNPPLFMSEIYYAPEGLEPEWIELYVATDSALPLSSLVLADTRDTAHLEIGPDTLASGEYLLLTSDTLALRDRYPGLGARVWQATGWPTLNNDGDTITLLLAGALLERVAFPSAGSRRGTSLERIGDSEIWGSSVAADGATPGRKNSIDVPYSTGLELSVTPNPIAAGEGEQASIRFRVPFAATGELNLYAGDGRHLVTLIEAAPLVSGQLLWDGRDDQGRLLPVGIYLLHFRLSQPRPLARLTTIAIAR